MKYRLSQMYDGMKTTAITLATLAAIGLQSISTASAQQSLVRELQAERGRIDEMCGPGVSNRSGGTIVNGVVTPFGKYYPINGIDQMKVAEYIGQTGRNLNILDERDRTMLKDKLGLDGAFYGKSLDILSFPSPRAFMHGPGGASSLESLYAVFNAQGKPLSLMVRTDKWDTLNYTNTRNTALHGNAEETLTSLFDVGVRGLVSHASRSVETIHYGQNPLDQDEHKYEDTGLLPINQAVKHPLITGRFPQNLQLSHDQSLETLCLTLDSDMNSAMGRMH